MRKLLLLLMVCLISVSTFAAEKIEISFLVGSTGHDVTAAQRAADMYMEKNPNVKVKVIAGPKNTTDILGLLLQNFEAKSADIDVFNGDVIWPGDLSEHCLSLNKYMTKDEIAAYNPGVILNNTSKGELKAIPLFIDVPMLYYRTDLLKKYGYTNPPETWKEMEEMAKKIQDGEREAGNRDFCGFVWQGDAYEGLTCDALEWIASNDGGTIVEPDGKVSIANANAIEALDSASKWPGTISPKGVLGFNEEASRAVWQAGNAAFMRNWPYAYALGEADDSVIKGKFDFTTLPKGKGKSSCSIGGWEIFVSKYTDVPEEAVKFAKFAAGYEVQKMRVIDYGWLPAYMSVYDDPDVAKNAFVKQMGPIVANGVARPSTVTAPNYAEVSRIFFTTVHKVISGEISAKRGAKEMAVKIKKMM